MNITGRGDEITVKQETLFTGEQGEQGNTLYSRGWTHRGRGMRRGFARGWSVEPRGRPEAGTRQGIHRDGSEPRFRQNWPVSGASRDGARGGQPVSRNSSADGRRRTNPIGRGGGRFQNVPFASQSSIGQGIALIPTKQVK